jgi:hypothetical protein
MLAHSLRSRILSVVILMELSGGLVAKLKLLMKFLVIEEIFFAFTGAKEPSQSLKKLAVSMQRLLLSQNSWSQQMT